VINAASFPTAAPDPPLHQRLYSLDHRAWVETLATTENLLIVQDLDGVCMELVQDPLHRRIALDYVEATRAFEGHFYVLTNGEHMGPRGVNGILERAWATSGLTEPDRAEPGLTQSAPHYLPGLAAGGVQWQTQAGDIEHPGVSEAELAFLATVPQQMGTRLEQFFQRHGGVLSAAEIRQGIAASALDNPASPTANLNTFHRLLAGDRPTYVALQREMQHLMADLLSAAAQQGLADSFFVHYAPNHGRDADGGEVIWWGQGAESGTTDFQFMLRGAIKEAGVLALLNRYYAQRTGAFPLGENFSVRQAPHHLEGLLELVEQHFDPVVMPTLVGVGDTVTSVVVDHGGQRVVQRGGSDRHFLQLIQVLGQRFNRGNLVTYVDSSGGELKNRKAIQQAIHQGQPVVVEGPGDPRDTEDPLRLNVVFPGGYRQYCAAFQAAAQARRDGQKKGQRKGQRKSQRI
jgi:glucosylglycerol 3-phosphatase